MFRLTEAGNRFFNNAADNPDRVRHLYKSIGFREGEHGDDDAVTLSISLYEDLSIPRSAEHGDTTVTNMRKIYKKLEDLDYIEKVR